MFKCDLIIVFTNITKFVVMEYDNRKRVKFHNHPDQIEKYFCQHHQTPIIIGSTFDTLRGGLQNYVEASRGTGGDMQNTIIAVTPLHHDASRVHVREWSGEVSGVTNATQLNKPGPQVATAVAWEDVSINILYSSSASVADGGCPVGIDLSLDC